MLKVDKVRNFNKVGDSAPIPNLIQLQTTSYARFVQEHALPGKRKNEGLEALLREVFPIVSYDETMSLEYVNYELGESRYKPQECRDLRLTYGLPFRIRCRFKRKDVKTVLEESIYVGEIPIMTGGGEFIINGAERVIVSQLHRSPGVDFTVEMQESDRPLHGARIIPERGSWIELAVTKKDSITMRIDQSSKIPATMFLRSMSEKFGTTPKIIREFYETDKIAPEQLRPQMYLVEGYIDPESGEELVPAGGQVGDAINQIVAATKKKIEVVSDASDPLILNTIAEDPSTDYESAILRIYARLRPGNPAQLEKAKTLFAEKFYDENRYRLGRVGRFRINRKFRQNVSEDEMVIRAEDFVNTMRYMLDLRSGEGHVDDIDHLGNRRLRTIDELAADEIRRGFLKLRRTVQERMSLKDPEEITKIAELVNSKSISSSIDFFFGRGELSQVVDQQNPLAQLTHERRLSALGPGGLNRKRAGFEVRDVHISHYGRICPIETPEGNNIGLISSMGIYAGIDDYGFLNTPYISVENRKVNKDKIVYLRADEEMEAILAPPEVLKEARTRGDITRLPEGRVLARVDGELSTADSGDVKYIDISPKQTVGISASLIPFLEHDDANRALMGSNMQRQAVPLLRAEAPIVATGMERSVVENSGFVVCAKNAGVVTFVDSKTIVIGNSDEYELRKFSKLNERACLNQRPIVREGQRVKKGQIIADGSACSNGELALGRNVLVAFMPYDGYNFEDAILISEKLVRADTFTSLHMEEYEVEIRETKLGREEFTRDIPNVSEKALRYLDENGVVQIGTRVGPGDILVGKVSPKSKSELSPEEKLLHAIFGRAGEDVKNDSLELPAGEEGVVVDTVRFSRRVHMSDEQKKQLKKDMKDYEAMMNGRIVKVFHKMVEEMNEVLGVEMVDPSTRQKVGQSENLAVIMEQVEGFNKRWMKGSAAAKAQADALYGQFWPRIEELQKELARRLDHMKRGDELPSGVLEMVKIRIATKRKLGVGDKMAGRHGNKGVIARILPEQDMPFLEDGTPVEILLNPLGVPGRMNLGQILETHLGWAAAVLGFQAVTPVFDGASEEEIFECIAEANEYVRNRTGRENVTAKLESLKKKRVRKDELDAREKIFEKKELSDLREKYFSQIITNYAFVSTENASGGLSKKELEQLEDALILSYPDKERCSLYPRFNRKIKWDNAIALVAQSASLSKHFSECKAIIDDSNSRKWQLTRSEEDRKKIGNKQGIYFFRNAKTGRVNEGYIGLASSLSNRLRDHFSGNTWADNLWKRLAEEELWEAREVIQQAGETHELLAEMPIDGKVRLRDGRTGKPFEQKTTVGYIYMNKLHHLVDEKIHARATGPYSLITQQPLGGKARTGGQRFGEMEVWGLEAYGASYTLQELLTVKSDDVEGRTKIYESMVKGQNTLEAGTPVSFDVLCNELRGLGLNIQLEKKKLNLLE